MMNARPDVNDTACFSSRWLARWMGAAAVLLAMLGVAPSALACDRADDLAQLLEGVESIGRPGVPGPIVTISPQSFPVVLGGRSSSMLPVVAAAAWEGGRVVAFGHGGFFGREALEQGQTLRLVENAARWAAGVDADHATLHVVVCEANELAALLRRHQPGWTVSTIRAAELARIPDAAQVVIADVSRYRDEASRESLARFVKRGGGLLTAGLGWGWMQLNPGKDLATEHPGNQLLAEAGLLWADGYLDGNHPDGYGVPGPPPALAHAAEALDRLMRERAGELNLAANERALAGSSLLAAARAIPATDPHLRPRLHALMREVGTTIAPREQAPLRQAAPLERLVAAIQIDEWKRDPARQQPVHPSAAFFPGAVPAQALRESRAVVIDPARHGWKSTGLYAAAGELIELHIGAALINKGLRLRIGAHSDSLWHLDSWKRMPEIAVSVLITAETMRLSSPFGGLIYIELPARAADRPFEVRITNAVAAPYFVLGETSLETWRDTLRAAPAPWAELASDKVILTVPSEAVRGLDDPAALMEAWDRVLDACADLAVIPRERARPERFVTDMQISAGYMHSGYPIMTHLDVIGTITDQRVILRDGASGGAWGFFHELGHNHQRGEWTFDGTVEVTCNLFSLYVLETVGGQPVAVGHGAITPEQRARRTVRHLAEGAPFNRWKNDPFLALEMYMQLRESFGWEPFKQVIGEYHGLSQSERPRNDQEKRDQWMMRFARAVNHDLGPFFERWGVPTSAEARAAIAHLPGWMPEGFALEGE